MEIAVAHSPAVAASDSWILKTLANASNDEVVYQPERIQPIPVEASMHFNVEKTDGLVADLKEPDSDLERMAHQAHMLGKGVLIFLPPNENAPRHFLPSFGEPPKHDTENRIPYAYYMNPSGKAGKEIAVHRGAMREMKLKLWLGSHLIRLREEINLLDEQYGFEISPGTYVSGKEADERLARFDRAFRDHGLPGLDD